MNAILPMQMALSELTSIVEYIEDHDGDCPDELIPAFDMAVHGMRAAVDHRIQVIESIEGFHDRLTKMKAEIKRRMAVIENVIKRIKEQTKEIVTDNPDYDFRGSFKRLAVQKNGGQAPVEWLVGTASIANVVSATAPEPTLDPYISVVTCHVLDKERVLADLAAGKFEPLSYVAPLERGTQLRIR